MADLDELRAKLDDHKKQLARVQKLIQRSPENETFLVLKRDLEQIIEMTEKLVAVETKKSAPSSSSSSSKVEVPKKKTYPREWGEEKSEWNIGDRCQAIYTDGKWYIAEITDIGMQSDSNKKLYTVFYLDYGNEHQVTIKDLRTFVSPLLEEVKEGDTVRAFYEQDGMFFEGIVKQITPEGKYEISFRENKKNNVKKEDVFVDIYDIQLKRKKKNKQMFDLVDAKGRVIEKFKVPEYLRRQEDDTDETKRRKKKRINALKKKHGGLLRDQVRNDKKSNWQNFKQFQKKSKAFRYKKEKRSIFASPDIVEGKVGVTNSGNKMTNFKPQDKHHSLRKDPNTMF